MKTTATLIIFSLTMAGSLAMAAEKVDFSKLDFSKLPPVADKKGVTYAKDIRPILEESCFRCHGEERQKGDLRLDSLQDLLKGGEDGKVVAPGDSKKSLLVAAVAQVNDEIAMPPKRRPGGPGGPGGPGRSGGQGGPGNRPPGGPGFGDPPTEGPSGPGGLGGAGNRPPRGPDGGSPPAGAPGGPVGPGGERGPVGPAGPGRPGGFGGGGFGPPAKPLTPEQIGLIRAWIDQGAK